MGKKRTGRPYLGPPAQRLSEWNVVIRLWGSTLFLAPAISVAIAEEVNVSDRDFNHGPPLPLGVPEGPLTKRPGDADPRPLLQILTDDLGCSVECHTPNPARLGLLFAPRIGIGFVEGDAERSDGLALIGVPVLRVSS
jgi:hypothetical protein